MANYVFGRWKQVHGYATPGGTPVFVRDRCGGSKHLHGMEYPERKKVCDQCGSINIYPWEKIYDEGLPQDEVTHEDQL